MDTGSLYSLCSLQYAKRLNLKINKIDPTDIQCLSSVSGEKLPILGQVVVCVDVKGCKIDVVLFVLDSVSQPVLFGVKFFKNTSSCLDYENGCVHFFGNMANIPFNPTFGKTDCSVSKLSVLKPNSETFVTISVPKVFQNKNILLSPLEFTKRQSFGIASSVNIVSDKCQTICRILNPTDKSITLQAGRILASAGLLGENSEYCNSVNVICADHNNTGTQTDTHNVQSYPHTYNANQSENQHTRTKHINHRTVTPEFRYSSQIKSATNYNHVATVDNFVDNNCYPFRGNEYLDKACQTEFKPIEYIPAKKYKFEELKINFENSTLTTEEREKLVSLIDLNGDCFAVNMSDIKQSSLYPDLHIEIRPDAIPKRQRPYKTSPTAAKEISRQVNELLENNLIEHSDSFSSSPVLLVKKSSGAFRLVFDFRYVNMSVADMSYPLPTLDDVSSLISSTGAQYLSSLDFYSGFNQLNVRPQDTDKLSFSTPTGQFKFKRLLFGFKSSPVLFQKAMCSMFRKFLGVKALCYVDDLIICSPTFETHLKDLQDIFDTVRQWKLKLSATKCIFGRSNLNYLGYNVSTNGISISEEKIKIIKTYPRPINQLKLKAYLGFTNYFKKLIPSYSLITSAFQNLLKQEAKFVWNDLHQKAFELLQSKLLNAPVLEHYNPDLPLHVITDASHSAIAYIIVQPGENNVEHMIFAGGRFLNSTEKRRSIADLESLAIVYACQSNAPLLLSKKFHVYTDHLSLQYIQTFANKSGRLYRYSIFLSPYTFECHYKCGRSNVAADTLSRLEQSDYLPQDLNPSHSFVDVSLSQRNSVLLSDERIENDNDIVPSTTDTPPSHPSPTSPVCLGNDDSDISAEIIVNYIGETHVSSENISESSENISDQVNHIDPMSDPRTIIDDCDTDENDSSEDLKNRCFVRYDFSYNEEMDDLPVSEQTTENFVNFVDASEPSEPDINELLSESEANTLIFDLKCTGVDMAVQQRLCTDFSPIIKYLEEDILPDDEKLYRKILCQAENYFIGEDGILLHKSPIKGKNLDRFLAYREQIALPISLRQEVMIGLHDNLCHQSIHRSYAMCAYRFYWATMWNDIRRYCLSCDTCARTKTGKFCKAPLTSIPVNNLFDRWEMDILKLPKDGIYNCCLVMIEVLSRHVEVIPLSNYKAETIAHHILCIVTRFGAMTSLQSDFGAEFVNPIVNHLCDLLRVKRLRSSSYHPRSSGSIERTNRTLITRLRSVLLGNENWVSKLPMVLLAMRATPCTKTTLFSPFEVLYGVPMRVPTDLLLDIGYNQPTDSALQRNKKLESYVNEMRPRLALLRQLARENTFNAQLKTKEYYDKNAKTNTIAVGAKVLVFTPFTPVGKSPKLHIFMNGPYLVLANIGLNNYVLQHCESKKILKKPVNIERLKMYYCDKDNLTEHLPQRERTDRVDNTLVQGESVDIGKSPTTSRLTDVEKETVVKQVIPSVNVQIDKIIAQKGKVTNRMYRVRFVDRMQDDKWLSSVDIDPVKINEFYITEQEKVIKKKRALQVIRDNQTLGDVSTGDDSAVTGHSYGTRSKTLRV